MINSISNRTIKNNQKEIVILTKNNDIFLISEEYVNILCIPQSEYFYTVKFNNNKYGIYNNSKLYELVFNETLSSWLLERIIKGILQFKILSFPSPFIDYNRQNHYRSAYKDIKKIYKDLIEAGINKKLTMKEKLIIKLLV